MSGITILKKVIEGESLIFTDHSALFWERKSTLIISDLHVGKTAHFRKNGIPVPSNILIDDIKKLEMLLRNFNCNKLIIVGDFLHAGHNSDIDIFCNWRRQFPDLEIILVKGNHDRVSDEILKKACIKKVVEELYCSPFTLIHKPADVENRFCISGHLHPGVLLDGKIQRMKFPCYAISDRQLILPAFSKFTGLDYKTLGQNYIKIAFEKGYIFEV